MNLQELQNIKDRVKRDIEMRGGEKEYRVVVSMGTSGIAAGARDVMRTMLDEIARLELDNVEVTATGGLGLEGQEPVVRVERTNREPITYGNLTPDAGRQIILEHIVRGNKVEKFVIGKLKG